MFRRSSKLGEIVNRLTTSKWDNPVDIRVPEDWLAGDEPYQKLKVLT
jgi:hypothetical protein